jgi:hypothetical protein
MKAIVFFEGKEVCQVECDKHVQFDNGVIFSLNDVIVGSFSEGYCFVIDQNKNERWYVSEADIHNLQRPCNTNNTF